MKWTCHICGRERMDERISVIVHKRKIAGVPFDENVRYCNDDMECTEKAKTFSFIKKEGQ
jgi:hypothetical protein